MADETDTLEATAADAGDGGAEAAAVDELHQGLLDAMAGALGEGVVGSHIAPGHGLWVRVARDAWFEAADVAKNRLGCTFFDFLSGIDWMPSPWGRYEDAAGVDTPLARPQPDAEITTGCAGGDTRFQVLCRVANIRRHHALVLKADLPDDDLRVASLVPLYGGASWHERECWEMFGFTFDDHPGLRHLYLPGGFEGHPLRKDFPLVARLVKPWPGIVDVEPMPQAPGDNGDAAGGDEGDGGDA